MHNHVTLAAQWQPGIIHIYANGQRQEGSCYQIQTTSHACVCVCVCVCVPYFNEVLTAAR